MELIHLIYTSAATHHMKSEDLQALLAKARSKNANSNVSGVLLFENGSFFQVLEGVEADVDETFQRILADSRHDKVTIIMREPIFKRSFQDWTMGFATDLPPELDDVLGVNDFFAGGKSFQGMNSGRAKKLLEAFRQGRWRSKVTYTATPQETRLEKWNESSVLPLNLSFAFQPIVAPRTQTVVGYEAYLCGAKKESFNEILPTISERDWTFFDTCSRAKAIDLASTLNFGCNLHLNFLARNLEDARNAIWSTLKSAERDNFEPSRIILEIGLERLIGEPKEIGKIIEEYRSAGLRISIDHFGAGRAGLNLLEPLRPEMISLSKDLVTDIAINGSRQAILRGILQTCNDLGIDLIAKHVEKIEDYYWMYEEGVELFQGNLIAREAFEELPVPVFPHEKLI